MLKFTHRITRWPGTDNLIFLSGQTESTPLVGINRYLTNKEIHSSSFKIGTIRGFICARYTIAHLAMQEQTL